MQEAGLRPNQVSQVRGYADQKLRVPANPMDPSNRRISLIVQYLTADAPPDPALPTPAPVPPGSTTAPKSAIPDSAKSEPAKPDPVRLGSTHPAAARLAAALPTPARSPQKPTSATGEPQSAAQKLANQEPVPKSIPGSATPPPKPAAGKPSIRNTVAGLWAKIKSTRKK